MLLTFYCMQKCFADLTWNAFIELRPVSYPVRVQTRGAQVVAASIHGCGSAGIFSIRGYLYRSTSPHYPHPQLDFHKTSTGIRGCLTKLKLWIRIMRRCRPVRAFTVIPQVGMIEITTYHYCHCCYYFSNCNHCIMAFACVINCLQISVVFYA